ncbi:MAG: TIGR02996 domain-containing protein [Polyangiaceae bacterium]
MTESREERRPRDRRLADIGKDGESLLRDVLAHPDDDEPRLVYADYLLSRGDPRGEFIVVQCKLARLTEGDPEFEVLDARATALLEKHQSTWVQPFMGDRYTMELAGRKWTRTTPSRWDFHRGFVHTATVSAEAFPLLAAGLFSREPVRRVHLTNHGLGRVLNNVKGLRELDLSNMRLKDEARALFACENFEALEVLELRKCGLGVKGARAMALAKPERWPRLRHLGLGENALGDAALTELSRAPLLSAVRSLELSREAFTAKGWSALVKSPYLSDLEALDVNAADLGAACGEALAASGLTRTLTTLSLRFVRLADGGLAALVAADFPALRVLRLPANQLTDRAVDLLRGGWVERLEVLDVSENDPTSHWDNALSDGALDVLRRRFGARLVT